MHQPASGVRGLALGTLLTAAVVATPSALAQPRLSGDVVRIGGAFLRLDQRS